MDRYFTDRREAGAFLAKKLSSYQDRTDVVVLGLARGGVPVAHEVAKALGAPLDVCVVRKLGVPSQPELAMGAIGPGGVRVLNQEVVDSLRITADTIAAVAREEQAELERREAAYRENRPPADVDGHVVILVDDGLATGSSMRAAVEAMRARFPARIVVGVPVGARETCQDIGHSAEEVVCALTLWPFFAVGQWYDDFGQTTDDEVRDLLRQSAGRSAWNAHHATAHGVP
jgi:putative phosphoribosyl transferase